MKIDNIDTIKKYISENKSVYGFIKNVYDDDYGCEERKEDQNKLLIIEIITETKTEYRKIQESKFDTLNYHEGTYLSFEDEKNFI